MAPVSPRQKSMYVWPSTQVNEAPWASATNGGYGLDQRVIQFMGDAVEHVVVRPLGELQGARAAGAEQLVLAHLEARQTVAVDGRGQIGHLRIRRPAASRASLVCVW